MSGAAFDRRAPRRHRAYSAGLLAGALALAAAKPAVAQAQTAQIAEARTLFEEGMRLVEAERWGEALEFFRRSRALAERPSTVFNTGSVLLRLGRMAEAIETLEAFLRVSDAAANSAERAEAQRLLGEARLAQGRLALALSVADARVFVDAGLVAGAGERRALLLDPGTHNLRVVASGYAEESLSVSVLPGQSQSLAVTLRAMPTRLLLTLAPASAQVALDGVAHGAARTFDVAPGAHALGLSAAGYLPIERTFNVALGQSLSLDLALSNRPSTSITASPWFWTAVGAVTLGAVVAVAFAAAPTQLAPYGGSTGVVISGASSAP